MNDLRIIFWACCALSNGYAFSQTLSTQWLANNSLPDIENPFNPADYDFVYPIKSDLLTVYLGNPSSYNPSLSNRYEMSLFGPRYKTTNGTNTTTYDFHQGEDFSGDFTYNGVTYTTNPALIQPDSSNLAQLICMCDGVIDQVVDGTLSQVEALESGRSVRVKCNATFKGNHASSWGNIYISYYHMSKIFYQNVTVGQPIAKGDTLGRMGSTGLTDLVHLHLNVYRKSASSYINVHPMRLFDPSAVSYLHTNLQTANMEHLYTWINPTSGQADSSLFRIAIPRAQNCLKSIRVKYGASLDIKWDFENVSKSGAGNRDNPTYVPGITMLAYQFNRAQTAHGLYQSTKAEMNSIYPASPNRAVSKGVFPIPNSFPYNDPSGWSVFDMMLTDLSSVTNYSYANTYIEISDIYGNVVFTDLPMPITLIDFHAECTANGSKLSWKTKSEINNDKFILEQSPDGQAFKEVTILKGGGTTSELRNYSFEIDDHHTTHMYYRLKQIDFDGQSTLSETIASQCKSVGSPQLSVFPNPAQDHIQIKFNQPATSTARLTLISSLGNILSSEELIIEDGAAQIPIAKLSGGIYFLIVNFNGVMMSAKVIKN